MRSPQRLIAILALGGALSACSTAGPSAAASATAPSSTPIPTDSGAASPKPTALSSPTADPRPALAYPEHQSHGAVSILLSSPALPAVTIPLVCDWGPGPAVYDWGWGRSRGGDGPWSWIPAVLAGEEVGLNFYPRETDYPVFAILRKGRSANYWPGPGAGSVELLDSAANWASGTIRLDGLAPNPETADPGPLPSPLADWIRPLGGDPAMASLTGTVTWMCEPAPPEVPVYDPIVSDEDEPSPIVSDEPSPFVSQRPGPPYPDGVPPVVLVSGDQRRLGDTACGSYPDVMCGPEPAALGVESIVRIPAGGKLRFELPAECHFIHWELIWVSQSEHERWRGLWPDTAQHVADGERTKGRVLELAAPPVGDWSVDLNWESSCDGPDNGLISDLFRVVVAD